MAEPKVLSSSQAPVQTKDEVELDAAIEFSPGEERRLRRKFDFYILPPLTFM